MRALAIDLFCGLGGWTEGLMAEGYRVVGFDNERHHYGEARYPAQLVIQDVLTLHGSQFKDAALIVASPPCQEFSYMAMPWTRAKEKAAVFRDGRDDPKRLTALFDACFRIQREACEAAGHHIPLVVENVCGAQKWVGRARWHYGSFYLWGDVPALMPITMKRAQKFNPDGTAHPVGSWFAIADSKERGASVKATKNDGGSWFAVAHNTTSGHGQNPDGRNTIANAQDGCKQKGSGAAWWRGEVGMMSSKSSARKAASAHIAKIPLELSRHIAKSYYEVPS